MSQSAIDQAPTGSVQAAGRAREQHPGGVHMQPTWYHLWQPRPPVSVQRLPVCSIPYLHRCSSFAKDVFSLRPTRRLRLMDQATQSPVLPTGNSSCFVRFDPGSPVLIFYSYPVHDVLPICLWRVGRHGTILFPCTGPFLSG